MKLRRSAAALLLGGLLAGLLWRMPLPPAPPLPTPPRMAVVSAVGDLTLDLGPMREIQDRIRADEGDLAALDYPFAGVRSELRGAVFGNLEGPVTQRGIKAFADKDEIFYFRSPTRAARSLARAGFDVLSLANNHIKDCGVEGMFASRLQVQRQGMQAVGVGKDLAEARQPVFVREGGSNLAFLAYVLVKPVSVWATSATAGAATGSAAELAEDVRKARAQADAVIVSLHWGKEVGRDLPVAEPSEEQVLLARGLIDAGATLVLGSHSHAVGRFEAYKQGLIAYSLGNFIFAGTRRSGHKHSVILRAVLQGDRVRSYSLVPVWIDPAQALYQGRLLDRKASQELLQRFEPAGGIYKSLY